MAITLNNIDSDMLYKIQLLRLIDIHLNTSIQAPPLTHFAPGYSQSVEVEACERVEGGGQPPHVLRHIAQGNSITATKQKLGMLNMLYSKVTYRITGKFGEYYIWRMSRLNILAFFNLASGVAVFP